jgi:hypothetical protein
MEGRRESKESGMWGGNRGHPDAPEILVATPAIAMILTAKKTKSARECPCVRLRVCMYVCMGKI